MAYTEIDAQVGLYSSIPKFFKEEILKWLRLIDGTAYYSGHGLDNIDQTHQALAIGKLVPQKMSV